MIDTLRQLNERDVISVEPLLVGGSEGRKHRVTTSSESTVDGEGKVDYFVSKEYAGDTREFAFESVAVNNFLFENGYPVPEEASVVEIDSTVYAIMSDVTVGGKYLIWGWSTGMAPEQMLELKRMNLVAEEIEQIRTLVENIGRKADGDKLRIFDHCYHIRRSVETGEIDIVLLDFDGRITDPGWRKSEDISLKETRGFLSKLRDALMVVSR